MGLLDSIRFHKTTYRIADEAIYAEVLREMESGMRRDGIWAMVLAESPASEAHARSRYINLRVQSLKDEIAAIQAALLQEAQQLELRQKEDEYADSLRKYQKEESEKTARLDALWAKMTRSERRNWYLHSVATSFLVLIVCLLWILMFAFALFSEGRLGLFTHIVGGVMSLAALLIGFVLFVSLKQDLERAFMENSPRPSDYK